MLLADDRQDDGRWWSASLIVLLGVAAAWATLSWIGWQQQQQFMAAAIPFAYQSVLVVHLLCVLPFAIWSARCLTFLGVGRLGIPVWILVGVGLSAASVAIAPQTRPFAISVTNVERQVFRLAWCWILLSPWCIAAVVRYVEKLANASRSGGESAATSNRKFLADGLISFLFALLPIVHVQQVVERRTALFTDVVINQQYVAALEIAERLQLLGAAQISDRRTADLVENLQAKIVELKQNTEHALPADATIDERLERASQLYGLGRFEDVRLLLSQTQPDPRVDLRLAVTDEAERDYRQAAAGYQRTIDALAKLETLDSEQQRLLRIAFERRVNNLRRIGESRQAEQELVAALNTWPQIRDALLLQLGFHYQMAGRTAEAVDFFQQAAAENPRLQPQAEAAMVRWQQQAEGCLLRTTRGATR